MRRPPQNLKLVAALGTVFVLLFHGHAANARRTATGPLNKLSATTRTSNFVVRHEPEDPFLARLLARTAEAELKRIAADIGYDLTNSAPFKLYVFSNHADFLEAGGLEIGKLTVGTVSLGTEEISVDASGVFDLPERILAHEITHAVIFRLLGALAVEMPLWMHEGLAKYESRESAAYDDEMVATAAAEGSVIPLSKLRDSFPRSRTGLAYAESASAIRFLVARFGRDAPRKLIENLNKTGSFDQAMISVTGRSTSAFEREWHKEISKRYKGLRRGRLATASFSVLMAALAVIAYLVRRSQKAEGANSYDGDVNCWEPDEAENNS